MRACQPCQGILYVIRRHPPLVVFFVCLMTFFFTLLAYGAYIHRHPVKDDTQDWDGFLKTLSLQKICPQSNATGPSPPSSELTASLSRDPSIVPEDVANVSILATIKLSPWQLVVSYTGLQIDTTGSHLGMRGPAAESRLMVTLTSTGPAGHCNHSDTACSRKYCVTVIGSQTLLPRSRSAPSCPESGTDERVLLDLYEVGAGPDDSHCCSLVYDGDSDLENIISQEERSLLVHRLLFAALCFLFLGGLLCVAATFCGQNSREEKWTPAPL